MSLQDYADSFKQNKRLNGEEYWYCDNADFQDVCSRLHFGRLPNDQDYSDIAEMAKCMADCEELNEDAIYNIANDLTEFRSFELVKMLQQADFREDVNELMREPYPGDIERLCAIAHCNRLEQIGIELLNIFGGNDNES